MSDQDEINPEQAANAQAQAQAQAQGQGTPSPSPSHAEPEMPMLAASAAARLTRAILARVNSPHAAANAQPLRGDLLWRQVTRRLGGPGHAAPPVGSYRAMQPPSASLLPPVPHGDLVWRAAHHKGTHHETEVSGWIEPSWPAQQRPVSPAPPPVPAPEQTQPSSTAEARAAFTPYVPEGMPEPPAQSQAEAYAEAIESRAEGALSEQAAASLVPPTAEQAAIERPVQDLSEAAPPVFVPPKVVRVEFVPGPAIEPPRPLAEPRISVPEPTRAMHGSMSRHLHSELNRDMVPTTDLLSRMNFNYEVEVVPARPRPEPSTQPPPPPAAVVEMHPTAPLVPLDMVTAGPPREITPVEMPLTTQPQVQARRGRGRGETEYIEDVQAAPRGFFGRVFDRVASALPEPVRRAFEGGERPVSPVPPALSLPPSAPAEPQQAPPVEAPTLYTQTSRAVQPAVASDAVSTPRPANDTQASPAGSVQLSSQPVIGGESQPARSAVDVPSEPLSPASLPPAPRAAQEQTAQPVERAATGQAASRIMGESLASAPVSPQTAQATPPPGTGSGAQVQRQPEVQQSVEVTPASQAQIAPPLQQASLPGVQSAETPQSVGETGTPVPSPSEAVGSVPVQTSPAHGVSRGTYEPYRPEAPAGQGYTPAAAEPQQRTQGGLFSSLRNRLFGGSAAQGSGTQPLEMPWVRTSRQPGNAELSEPYDGGATPYRPYSAPVASQAQTTPQQPAYIQPPTQVQAHEERAIQAPTGGGQAPPDTMQLGELPAEAPPEQVQTAQAIPEQPVDTAVPYSTAVDSTIAPASESGMASSLATQAPAGGAAPEAATQAIQSGQSSETAVAARETVSSPYSSEPEVAGGAARATQGPEEPLALAAAHEPEALSERGGTGPRAGQPPAPPMGSRAELAGIEAGEQINASVQPEAPAGSTEPESTPSDGGSASTRPFVVQPYMPPAQSAGAPRGLFGALRARLFGGAEPGASGPTPLDMPWVRTPRQRQDTGAGDGQAYGPEIGEQLSTPGTPGTYSTPGAPPAQYIQATPAYGQPSSEPRAGQIFDTPIASPESGNETPQPEVSAASQQPAQVEQALQAAVEQAVQEEREAQAAEAYAYEQSAIQDEAYMSPPVTTPPDGPVEMARDGQVPVEPAQFAVTEPEQSVGAADHVDTRSAVEGTRGMISLESVHETTPGHEIPAEFVPQGLDLQEEAASTQVEGGVWAAMAEMADEVMRSHAPVLFVHHTGGSRARNFLDRIFGGPGRLFQAAQGISGVLGSQPGPQFLAAAATRPGSTTGTTPELVNRTRVRLTEASPSELGGESDWFGSWTSQPQAAEGSRPGAVSVQSRGTTSNYIGQFAPPRPSLASEITRRQSAPLGGISQPGQAGSPSGAVPGTPVRYSPASSLAQSVAFSTAFEQASGAVSPGAYPVSSPSSLVDDTGLGVVRPLAQMSPSLGSQFGDAGETAQAEEAEWSQALREIYGEPGLAGMPLANPYGSFAVPSSPQAASTSSVQLPDALGGGQFTYEIPARASSMYLPASYSVGSAPEPEPYAPAGSIMDYSWGEYGSAGADEAAPAGEAGAWANVVSSAVSGPQPTAAPALALAGEERPAPEEHGAEGGEHEAGGGSPDLEELAETIYSIIKMKLIVERERSW